MTKNFYKLVHPADDLPVEIMFAWDDKHPEQAEVKKQGHEMLMTQRDFHVSKRETLEKRYVGVLYFKQDPICVCLFYPAEFDTAVAVRFFLTQPEHRGTGFGKLLCAGVKQFVDTIYGGVHEFELYALNDRAKSFWSCLGFSIVGKQKQKMRACHRKEETTNFVKVAVYSCRKKCQHKGLLPKPAEITKLEISVPDKFRTLEIDASGAPEIDASLIEIDEIPLSPPEIVVSLIETPPEENPTITTEVVETTITTEVVESTQDPTITKMVDTQDPTTIDNVVYVQI